MLKDKFGRIHNYLRISLTDRCNFQCLYCLPDPEFPTGCTTGNIDKMTKDEIVGIAESFVNLGIDKIRITGGEPLVRKDAAEIITALGSLGAKLAITTNGFRIDQFETVFRNSGITSINISLDTLHEDKFKSLTGQNCFYKVKSNIDSFIDRGYHVKVNMVVMNEINMNEVVDFVNWTKNEPVHVRFIEFMPFPGNAWKPEKLISFEEIIEEIKNLYPNIVKLEDHPNETTKKFQVPGHKGTFAVISTMSEPFCSGCNRLRLTSDGKLRNCLFSKEESDLLTLYRKGESLETVIQDCLNGKHLMLGGNQGSDWGISASLEHKRSMMGIGG